MKPKQTKTIIITKLTSKQAETSAKKGWTIAPIFYVFWFTTLINVKTNVKRQKLVWKVKKLLMVTW